MKIAAPKMCRGRPSQFSENGVSRTTTRSGTTKIRESVSEFGRFTIQQPDHFESPDQSGSKRQQTRVFTSLGRAHGGVKNEVISTLLQHRPITSAAWPRPKFGQIRLL